MASRRMFSPDIVESDAFLDMPVSSQCLYFHLGMSADDDGFVSPKKIMRTIGAKDDDLKVLLAKRFLLPFESGVVVIKHWLIHNMIRGDRYKPTMYEAEKNSLFLKDNKAYTDVATNGKPFGNQPAPQVRLGKDRLLGATPIEVVEVREDQREPKQPAKYKNARTAFSWFPHPEPSWDKNITELECGLLLFVRGEAKVKSALRFHAKHKDVEGALKIVKPSDLERKWNDLIDFAERNGL